MIGSNGYEVSGGVLGGVENATGTNYECEKCGTVSRKEKVRRQVWNLKRDAAEKPIVDALRAVGADVTLISGKGAPDLLVRFRGILVGLEVKTGKGKRTDAQEDSQWPIVRSVDEALQAVGAVGQRWAEDTRT
jgi:hypothetical protein